MSVHIESLRQLLLRNQPIPPTLIMHISADHTPAGACALHRVAREFSSLPALWLESERRWRGRVPDNARRRA